MPLLMSIQARSRWVPSFVGGILILAAGLKVHQIVFDPARSELRLYSWWVVCLLVWHELLLGCWLFSGSHPRQARLVGIGTFLLFLGVGSYHLMAGHDSCGCFGRLSVSPWISVMVSCALAWSLWAWTPVVEGGRKIRWGVTALLLMGIAGGLMLRSRPVSLGEGGQTLEGRVVRVEPADWKGKRFPLLPYVLGGENLLEGRWTVVLYRRDCSKCRRAIDRERMRLMEQAWNPNRPKLALIEVESASSPSPAGHVDMSREVHGHLTDKVDWMLTTPTVVRLSEGVVTSVGLSNDLIARVNGQ